MRAGFRFTKGGGRRGGRGQVVRARGVFLEPDRSFSFNDSRCDTQLNGNCMSA